ncbi:MULTISPECIES: TadE/TadG family type IV pilus assembly protein [Caulobacter]|jgi:Flp pilus assembly protein TadG|uniref:Flp pilus assembly protein TadG n=1 Tax=Caulobacter rhizosphaerae TaxID=2010972 RepID=A0ABU1N3N1_9CAUL|nr:MULTISPECIES: TadE/TadG family type IV pilus assembly protein [Caulobacter]MDR6533061.1 Flp pilus assembly protein TadG [Caulobacter rhizosphaerae]
MTSRPIPLLRRLLAGCGGSAAVEFALILPFMTLLCFAFVGAGRLFWNYHIAVSAVRDAARYAARLPMTCAGLTNAGDTTKVQNVARTGVGDGVGSPLIANWTSNASVVVTVSCVSNAGGAYSGRYEDMTGVPIVQVSASPPYIDSFGPLTGVTLTSFTVSAQQAWTE